MPHAIVEFSPLSEIGISEADLLDAVFDGMQASGLFGTEDIKVRSHPASMTRNGSDNFSFIHVQLRIMPGRTVEQKADLSERVRANVCSMPGQARSTSVEVVDIDRAVYAKTVVNSSPAAEGLSELDLLHEAVRIYLTETDPNRNSEASDGSSSRHTSAWFWRKAHLPYRPASSRGVKLGARDVLAGIAEIANEGKLDRVFARWKSELDTDLQGVNQLLAKPRLGAGRKKITSPDLNDELVLGDAISIDYAVAAPIWEALSVSPDLSQPDPGLAFVGDRLQAENLAAKGNVDTLFIRVINLGFFRSVEVLQALDSGGVRWVPRDEISATASIGVIETVARLQSELATAQESAPEAFVLTVNCRGDAAVQFIQQATFLCAQPILSVEPMSLWPVFATAAEQLGDRADWCADEIGLSLTHYTRWRLVEFDADALVDLADCLTGLLVKERSESPRHFFLHASFQRKPTKAKEPILTLDVEHGKSWIPVPAGEMRLLVGIFAQAVMEHLSHNISTHFGTDLVELEFDLEEGVVRATTNLPDLCAEFALG